MQLMFRIYKVLRVTGFTAFQEIYRDSGVSALICNGGLFSDLKMNPLMKLK
jgi:hypothetical protein